MEQPHPSSSMVEAIKQAIKQLMEEVKVRASSSSSSSSDDDADHRLLSQLMSQLERLEAEAEGNSNTKGFVDSASATKVNSNVSRLEEERIVKELKKVKRQNFITHCLVSVMIVLTVAWQISEVSIILKLKDGVTHPFRSIGSVFKRMLRPPKANGKEEETESLITSNLIESSPVNDVKIPELPHVELPKVGFT